MSARRLTFAVMLASWVGTVAGAAEAPYPSHPIILVVPFAAGGPTDTLARIIGERMRSELGQPIIIENITGAGGTIAGARVARATPDGYTITIGAWNTHVVNGAIYTLRYDVLQDFDPIALVANNYTVIVSKNAVPATDLKSLITWAKAKDVVTVGTAGAGASTHVAGVFFQTFIGAKFQFVPYRGAAPAMQDLMAGQIELMFDQMSSALQHVRSSKIRAYAVAADARRPAAPEIPTTDESGLSGFHISVWHGLWAPRGTPRDLIAKLNAAVVAALADRTVRRQLADLGQEIPAREQQSPEALGAYHKAEIERWWPIVKAANIKID
jgi:tripartite-type tricarboxylate transporter receptor subunit TctC